MLIFHYKDAPCTLNTGNVFILLSFGISTLKFIYSVNFILLQALIHLESIQPLPKRLDYLDSLVDKFVVSNPDSPNVSSTAEREELSSIFLEVMNCFRLIISVYNACWN